MSLTPTLGIVAALPEEFVAMRSLLDHASQVHKADDRATYVTGTLPSAVPDDPHDVVLTMTVEAGNDASATACVNLSRSFRSVNCVIMAGIAAGVPNLREPQNHVRLGDVVVATWGVVDYDHVDDTIAGPRRRAGFPKPSSLLTGAANMLRVKEKSGDRRWERWLDISAKPELAEYGRPPDSADVLYATNQPHRRLSHPDPADSDHRPGLPKVHYGWIGSADRSLRNAKVRDELAAKYDLRAFEMEGKGIGNSSFSSGLEWFVVRGISDYGDDRTNHLWRHYASLVAAAYVRALLAECAPLESRGGHPRGGQGIQATAQRSVDATDGGRIDAAAQQARPRGKGTGASSRAFKPKQAGGRHAPRTPQTASKPIIRRGIGGKGATAFMAVFGLAALIVAAVVVAVSSRGPRSASSGDGQQPGQSMASKPVPGTALAAYAVGEEGYVVYLDGGGNVHQFYSDSGRWYPTNLTVATGSPHATEGSPLVAYAVPGGSSQVLYIGSDRHIHGLSGGDGGWSHADLTLIAKAVPARIGSSLAGGAVGQVRYATYLGDDGQLHDLEWDRPAGARDTILTSPQVGAPSEEPNSPLTRNIRQSSSYVYYLDGGGYVQQIQRDTGGFAPTNLTAATQAPAAAANSPLAGYIPPSGSQHVLFVSADRHVRELVHGPSGWADYDLTSLAGTSPAASDSALVGYAGERGQRQHAVYIGGDGEVHELTWSSTGAPFDRTLTNEQTRAPSPARGTALVAYTIGSRQYVIYLDRSGNLRHLEGDAAGWHLAH